MAESDGSQAHLLLNAPTHKRNSSSQVVADTHALSLRHDTAFSYERSLVSQGCPWCALVCTCIMHSLSASRLMAHIVLQPNILLGRLKP